MTSANLTRDETAARAAGIRLHTIDVELDLRGARDADAATFGTATTLAFEADVDATWIDFIGASVDAVIVNGEERAVDWDGARVHIDDLAAHNTVEIRGTGRYSTSGEGLHRFVDPLDGEVYLYTQYEPADCRRVYPCFEQPDLKARWRFAVAAPAGWQVLSNGAEIDREAVAGGVRVRFAETLPLSSYITAVAAARTTVSRASGKAHPAPSRWACCAARRWHPTSTPTRSWTSRAADSRSSARPSGSTIHGVSTTRSSCPNTTSEPWRTRAS